jgi:uncharacterized protein
MYAAGEDHPLRRPCVRVIEDIRDGRISATISAEVVQEILHRFVAIRRPELGAALARHALDLFSPILAITHAVMDRMPGLIEQYPALAARDLVHVATCLEYGIAEIVSTDRGFDTVAELRRIAPESVAARR